MRLEINVDKRVSFLLFVGALLLLIVGGVFAWNPASVLYHDADEVRLVVEGTNYSLQEYVDSLESKIASLESDEGEESDRGDIRLESYDTLFGGAYRKADGNNYCFTKNPITNACSCPSDYTATPVKYIDGVLHHVCLAAPGAAKRVAEFGGAYMSKGFTNPITGANSCPSGYSIISIGGFLPYTYCYTKDLDNPAVDYFGGIHDSGETPLSYKGFGYSASTGFLSYFKY